jgi:hypothetical protein
MEEIPFIVCHRRKNQPKVSPQICEKPCKRQKSCPDYYSYIQPGLFDQFPKKRSHKRS